MSSLSAALLQRVVEELRPLFLGRQLRDVACIHPSDIVLFFERDAAAAQPSGLLLSIHPRFARIAPAQRRYAREEFADSPFVRTARRHLRGSCLELFSARPGDRACDLVLRTAGKAGHRLRCELYGPHGNLFLCAADDRVLAAMEPTRRRAREFLSERSYAPLAPPASPRSQPAPPPHAPDGPQPFTRYLLTALHEPAESERLERLRSRLAKRLERQLRRRSNRRDGLLARERETQRAEDWRRMGDLLKTSLHLVQRGADSVRVPDYFADPVVEVEIPLDPRLSPARNAERLYARYRRLRRGLETVAEELALARRSIAELEVALEELHSLSDPAAVPRLEQRLRASGHLPPRAVRRRGGERRQAPVHRSYRSADGLEILVGRSARDNDRLSFGLARGNDLWIHAADQPGSHVVVRLPRGAEPPEQTLLDAACLALHFSARPRQAGTVRYTRVKNLRRMRGAPPGQVSIARGHTLDLRHDPARLQRLLRGQRADEAGLPPDAPAGAE